MFFRILKKDLKRKRGINFILFLFMLMATIFVVSSVNNILIVTNATDYCLEKGAVPDEYIAVYGGGEDKEIDKWLNNNNLINDYSKNEGVILLKENIDKYRGVDGDNYSIDGTIILQSQWKNNMMIFDQEGKLAQLNDNEIGMQQRDLDKNNLKIGDTISFKFGDKYKEFKIAMAIKDPAFGSDFMGMSRYLINDNEYQQIKDYDVETLVNYGINTNDKQAFVKEFNKQAFNVVITLDKDTFSFSYVIYMITAGIMILVGVCLILIAFLILRFTIVFTLQEDYKEIGIMKAIGIRNVAVKKIYLIKYMVLVIAAAAIGCIVSVPVSNLMLESLSKPMLIEDAGMNFGINILCSVVVAAVVIGMCYLCTNKLKKYSAIEAIRSGQTGERFKKKSKLSMHKMKKMPSVLFLAVNDILSNIKRYVVLLLTFIIGIICIIFPANTISTFGSKEMAKNFLLDTDADFYIDSDSKVDDTSVRITKDILCDRMEKINQRFKDKGYETELSVCAFVNLTYYAENEDECCQVMSIMPLKSSGNYIQLSEGSFPEAEDEIVMSENIMKKLGVKIGNKVHVKLNGKIKNLIITGSYQNYMHTGNSVLLNTKIDISNVPLSGNWTYQGYLKDRKMTSEIMKSLKEDMSEFNISDMQETVNRQLGSASDQINGVKWLIIIVVCTVNILITVLMMKIFIMGEKSQIAMLRSIGYSVSSIRLWQMLRFGIVLIASVVLGIAISTPLNSVVLKPIFGMMGATHINIYIDVLNTYVLYPIILLSVILAAAFISSGSIKKLNLMEINNAE